MATNCSLTFFGDCRKQRLDRWNLSVALSWLKSLHLFHPLSVVQRKPDTEESIFTKLWFQYKARTHLHPCFEDLFHFWSCFIAKFLNCRFWFASLSAMFLGLNDLSNCLLRICVMLLQTLLTLSVSCFVAGTFIHWGFYHLIHPTGLTLSSIIAVSSELVKEGYLMNANSTWCLRFLSIWFQVILLTKSSML